MNKAATADTIDAPEKKAPTFTLAKETLDFMAQHLLGGGPAVGHSSENGRSHKISKMLASENGGFKCDKK